MNTMLEPIRAELEFRSNGDNAKSSPVRVVARSGDPIDHPFWGRVVHDFAGMNVGKRIPLDYAHERQESIGYLNKFDYSTGDLVCSGAIVPFAEDKGAEVVHKMSEGVPYEASIEFDPDCLLEEIPAGVTVDVNGRSMQGPVLVVREWELKAVAIVKFGADRDTQAELAFGRKRCAPEKGCFIRMSKSTEGKPMDQNTQTETVERAVEAATVEVAAEADVAQLSAPAVEAEVAPVATVDAHAPAEAAKVEEVAATQLTDAAPAVEAVDSDPRAEARKFIDTFGEVAGAKYFAAGLMFEAALSSHMLAQRAEIDALKVKLAAVDRGAAAPVTFTAVDKPLVRAGMENVIRIRGKQ